MKTIKAILEVAAIVIVIAIIVAGLICFVWALAEYESKREEATLIYVIDGDTIIVNGEHSGVKKVRFIGINSPEAGTTDGDAATAYLNNLLGKGQKLVLEKDTSETDKYDRLLRYVYIVDGKERIMVNSIMVAAGHAEVMTIPPDTKHQKDFEKLEGERNENY